MLININILWWKLILRSQSFKDARSVSLYPYNQPQIMQNVKYTK